MTAHHVLRSVQLAVDRLQDAGLVAETNAHQILPLRGDTLVTFVSRTGLSPTFGPFGTVEDFEAAVKDRMFSAVLIDGALLQMTYTLNRDTVVKHRLSYNPCPYQFSPDEFADFTLEDLLEMFSGHAPVERIRLESPLRFDFDPAAANEDHPAAHLTMNRDSCRVPVQAPLSPGHFVRFIAQHFYPQLWQGSEDLRSAPCDRMGATISPPSSYHTLFVDWRRED